MHSDGQGLQKWAYSGDLYNEILPSVLKKPDTLQPLRVALECHLVRAQVWARVGHRYGCCGTLMR